MRRWIRNAAALAGVTTALVAGAAPSPASAAAWLEGKVYLSSRPPSNFGSACVSRNIYLKAGAYTWKNYIVHPSYPHEAGWFSDWFRLRSATYLWKVCVDDAPWGQYVQCSWLDELPTLGNPAKFCRWQQGLPGGRPDGIYEFGSGLTWGPI